MIEFKLEKNVDAIGCSYCGGQHKEFIDMAEPDQSGSGFIMSRSCARKFINELKQYLVLHPSGV